MRPILRTLPAIAAASGDQMTYQEIDAFTGSREQLMELVAWRAGSPAALRYYIAWRGASPQARRHNPATPTEGDPMQRQFTIELRVDFADEEKNEAIRETLRQCARRALATANLIADNQKATRIAIWADDFYSGHEEIKLLDDVLGEVTKETVNETGGDEPSAEMLGALASDV